MKTYNIAIVGVGNIGYRHLEGLLKTRYTLNIFLFDINYKRLLFVKKSLKLSVKKNKKIILNNKISKILNTIDLLIVSSNSKERYSIIKKFIKLNKINNILLEKLVSYKVIEYKKIQMLLNANKVKNYINFPRRIFVFYNNIKKKLDNSKPISIKVNLHNWNIASNAIHFLDLFTFLTKRKLKVSKIIFDSKIKKSKRKGYSELTGKIQFRSQFNDLLHIEDLNNKNIFQNIIIEQETLKFIIFEDGRKYIMIKKNKHKVISKEFKAETILQSYGTKIFLDNIINKNIINLPNINESSNDHTILLSSFETHLKKVKINNHKKILFS